MSGTRSERLDPGLPPAVFLMGPTGAGKTALAVELVSRLGCGIVSVDSAMVYRGMNIGTAKPNRDVLARAPHRLIDIRDPRESYSAAEFRLDALREMQDLSSRGRIPLLAGGTGLYFRALEQGISELPPADPALRQHLEREAARWGWPELHRRLAAIDPMAAARIHPRDPQRIQRALEVYEVAGATITELRSRGTKRPLPYRVIKLVVAPKDRASLHERLSERFLAMLDQGLIEEVRTLYRRGDLCCAMPAIRLVGYRQVWQYLEGSLERDDMVGRAIAATRQLAKRQLTWFRAEPNAQWFDSSGPDRVACVLSYLSHRLGVGTVRGV